MSDQQFSLTTKHQSGAVLAISLIVLLLLTLIGITAAQVSGLEEKMAGNLRDRNLAFQAAETALRAGEERTATLPQCPIFTAIQGFYPHTDTPAIDDGANNVVWLDPTKYFGYSGDNLASRNSPINNTAVNPPRYIIQCITSMPGANSLYRITARGTGGTTEAVVILQSVYRR